MGGWDGGGVWGREWEGVHECVGGMVDVCVGWEWKGVHECVGGEGCV